MSKLYPSVIIILIVCLILSKLDSCNTPTSEIIKIDTVTNIVHFPIELKADTVTKDRIKYRTVIVYDTITRTDSIPIITSKEIQGFTAKSSRQIFKSGDSLTTEFRYPEFVFTFDFRPKADTITTITVEKIRTVNGSPFGVVLGAGITSGLDGIPRLGGFVGIGVKIF